MPQASGPLTGLCTGTNRCRAAVSLSFVGKTPSSHVVRPAARLTCRVVSVGLMLSGLDRVEGEADGTTITASAGFEPWIYASFQSNYTPKAEHENKPCCKSVHSPRALFLHSNIIHIITRALTLDLFRLEENL